MASLCFVRSNFCRWWLFLLLVFVFGCGSVPAPSAQSGSEPGPTLDSPHVIRVCVKQPGVPRHKDLWANDDSGRLVLDDWELALLQRNGRSIYYFDPDANPESAQTLPIPHNTLKCVEPAPSVLSSTGKALPTKPTREEQPLVAAALPTNTARAAEPPACTSTSEAGQKRSRSAGTQTCVRTRTLRASTRPAPAPVAKSEVESPALAQAAPEPAPTPPSLVDWKVGAPNFSVPGLDPQRVLECVGSLCHARHQNFVKKGSNPAVAGTRESRSLSPSGGGGAKVPQTRKPPTGPKSAATAKPAVDAGTPAKPKASEAPKVKEPNRNRVDDRPATLYEKVDKDGNLRKHGVTHHENPRKRYTEKQIGDGKVIRQERGPRKEMIKKERELVETNPGPENREPWAGKRKPPQTGGKNE